MTLLEAKYVMLVATTNIAGHATKNLDAVRDGWELYLHQETGGVFVMRGSETSYLSALCVQCVDLAEPLRAPKTQPSAPAERVGSVEHASKLADQVLAELDDAPSASDAAKSAQAARRKRR